MSTCVDWEHQRVETIEGIGPKLLACLSRLSIASVRDLLFHWPIRYEDRQRIVPAAQALTGDRVAFVGQVKQVEVKGQRKRMLVVLLADQSSLFSLRFFHFFPKQTSQFIPGQWLWCFGEIKSGQYGPEIIHPEYQCIDGPDFIPHVDNLTPVYPTTEGLKQFKIRALIQDALIRLEQHFLPDPLQSYLDTSWPDLQTALAMVHIPERTIDASALAHRQHISYQRLAFEELVAYHLMVLSVRESYRNKQGFALDKGRMFQVQSSRLRQHLSFSLTCAQERVLNEIAQDMAQEKPMLRLVQGDVGSGKTLVAAFSALQAISQGYQVALMAPTELLTQQHLINFNKWFTPLAIRIGLLSAQQKNKARLKTYTDIANGEIQLVIGTHALFQEHVTFAKLALVIIDEQHRFGVHQRLALLEKGTDAGFVPHQLVMTATPIPRTLAMTAYADLDYSVIDELPKGRQAITTVIVPDHRRDEVVERVRVNCLQEKRQAYWVCPLIDASEQIQCQAAQIAAEYLEKQCPQLKIGLLHGRMQAQEKQVIMQRFAQQEIDVLVATTVIEVGVDVPHASLMIIENAERLGLAQLHQLRGRVGRGTINSHCVLLYKNPLSAEARKRLTVMRETQDGFAIAKADLDIRGPGQWLGARQTGLIDFKVTDLKRDSGLITEAKSIAHRIYQQDRENAHLIMKRWLDVDACIAQV